MLKLFDNKYRFIKDLGQGGFGKVFLAKEEHAENLIAIKQLKPEFKHRQSNIIHEMQMVSKLNHPNIVAYKHHFEQDNLLFIVMEYCSLGNLRGMIFKKKITSTFIWKWMDELTKTLQFVHDKGIIHHDIKPDNILFTAERIIKISDFGVANTGSGTICYMSPEGLKGKLDVINDPRVDVYALGVTLMELLTGKNPFVGKSIDEIFDIHENKKFDLNGLPTWQQEIILKAINIIPEKRFQSMKEFNEALVAKSVPIIFDKEAIQVGSIADKISTLIHRKKWIQAINLLNFAEKTFKPNVNIFFQKGRYYLLSQQMELARYNFEKALKWNPRLDVQKELGWINLELKNYPTAISMLSDHLHRKPSDMEAYNLLLQCYYETERYETAIVLGNTLLSIESANLCFANNLYISHIMLNKGKAIQPNSFLKTKKIYNPFINYNYGVLTETVASHNFDKKPLLKSKLLFMDYRFNKMVPSDLYYSELGEPSLEPIKTHLPIISIGRAGLDCNNIQVPGGIKISRRHCVIINCKDDIWLYDLNSTGTYVNDTIVKSKTPLVGKNMVKIGDNEYEITNDKNKLF